MKNKVPRYLTKSRFTLALDCPTKLFYSDKTDEYANNSFEDDFLKELVKGGHQVGALAQCYSPKGIEIKGESHDDSVSLTEAQLKKKNVTMFEAAFRFKNLFVRVDVLIKTGNVIELIEVIKTVMMMGYQ